MEKIEQQSAINDSINDSVKKEEQRVIEEANRRMAEVHSRKAQEANKANAEIMKAKDEYSKKQSELEKERDDSITKSISTHSAAVIKKWIESVQTT